MGRVDAKICECGCGQPTLPAQITNNKRGWVKGLPTRFLNGHNWRGKSRSAKEKAILSANKTGERNHNWKGDAVGYQSLHIWLRKHFPKTGICEGCGKSVGIRGTAGTHYANISGEYQRDRADFCELCSSCHKLFDISKIASGSSRRAMGGSNRNLRAV